MADAKKFRIEMYNRRTGKWQPYPDANQPPDTYERAEHTLRVYQDGLERARLRVAEIPEVQAVRPSVVAGQVRHITSLSAAGCAGRLRG